MDDMMLSRVSPKVEHYKLAIIQAVDEPELMMQITALSAALSSADCANLLYQLAEHCHQPVEDIIFDRLPSGFEHYEVKFVRILAIRHANFAKRHPTPLVLTAAQHLAPLTVKDLHELPPRALGELSYAFATLDVRRSDLIYSLTDEAVSRIAQFDIHELTLFTHACDHLYVCPRNWLAVVYGEALKRFNEVEGEELAQLAWSCLQHNDLVLSPQAAIDDGIRQRLAQFSSVELTALAWAHAILSIQKFELMTALSHESHKRLIEFKPRELAMLAWAFAQFQGRQPELMNAISLQSRKRLMEFSPWEMSVLSNAYGELGLLDSELLKALYNRALQRLSDFDPFELTIFNHAFAKLNIRKPELLDATSQLALRQLADFKATSLSELAWTFATLDYCQLDLMTALSSQAIKHIVEFRTYELSDLAWSYVSLEVFEPQLMELICQRALVKLPQFKPGELVQLVWAVAAFNLPQHEFMTASIERLLGEFDELNLYQLGDLAWACAVARVEALPQLFVGVSALCVDFPAPVKIQFLQSLMALKIRQALTSAEVELYESLRADIEPEPCTAEPLQASVSQTLKIMNLQDMSLIENYDYPPYRFDIALETRDKRWAITLVDVSQQSENRSSDVIDKPGNERTIGAQVLKHKILQGDAWHPVSVSPIEWELLTDDTQRMAYLNTKLQIAPEPIAKPASNVDSMIPKLNSLTLLYDRLKPSSNSQQTVDDRDHMVRPKSR